MSYYFSSHVLLRMPVLPASDYGKPLLYYLQLSYFKAALWLASPIFYDQLEKRNFDPEQFSQREQLTLLKYVNRICFRPTPFGFFASVSLLQWCETEHYDPCAWLQPSIRPSQEWFVQYDYESEVSLTEQQFVVNPTLYRLLDEYRFIRTSVVGGKREYLLQSTAYSSVIQAVFNHIPIGGTGADLSELIRQKAGCSPEDAYDHLEFMVSSQLLVSSNRLGITGISAAPTLTKGLPMLQPPDTRKDLFSRYSAAWLIKQGAFLKGVLRDTTYTQVPFNAILIRKAKKETVPAGWQAKLSDGLTAIETLSPVAEMPAMEAFKQAFRKRFEQQEVSLLRALDPDTGIGYGTFFHGPGQPLLETIDLRESMPPTDGPRWTAAHAFLMQQWQTMLQQGRGIMDLDPKKLEKLGSESPDFPVSGMSILFRIAGEQLWLEAAGGVNAPALAGRFTVADTDILRATREMALQTEALYPQYLFAELLHLSDPHIDNVNVRESIWRYEIPITAPSSLPETQQILLSDLTLRISGPHIILWSVSQQKAVIPRLTSAYNHSLNRLPLFRFLADLSYQYTRSSFRFDLKDYFPGLSYYPRVRYRSTILQPATWILTKTDLEGLTDGPEGESPKRFNDLVKRLALPDIFYTGEGDQQIVIMPARKGEAALFLSLIKNKAEVVIREALDLITTQPQPHASTSSVRQYHAFVLPSDAGVYPESRPVPVRKQLQRKFIPGSEWLYLKIYVPKSLISQVLLKVRPLIYKNYSLGKIKKWFFIRYEDPAPHVRLRLHVEPAIINEILQAFKKALENRVHENVIREYQIDTYSRENERYHAGGLPATERFFWRSSEIVTRFLQLQSAGYDLPTYHFALITTAQIVQILLTDQDVLIRFYEESYQLFLPEFAGSSIRTELDQKYRQLRTVISGKIHPDHLTRTGSLKKPLQALIRSVEQFNLTQTVSGEKEDFVRSLVHLHLNRIFSDHARKQEMIIYFILFKYTRSIIARHQSSS